MSEYWTTSPRLVCDLIRRPDRRETAMASIDETLSAVRSGRTTALEDRWYASLAAGTPDFTIYDDPAYVGEAWACWWYYSRKYLAAVRTIAGSLEVATVADLGCGLGLTTATLVDIFPEARVYGTQLEGGIQYGVAETLGMLNGFDVRPRVHGHADLVFASEYLEHFQRPLDHLAEVLDETTPRYLIAASTFTAPSTGHFQSYIDADGARIAGREVARRVSTLMKRRGYKPFPTRFWNNKPAIWSLDSEGGTR